MSPRIKIAVPTDQEVMHCPAEGRDLVTSRNPGDLDAFNAKLIEVFNQ